MSEVRSAPMAAPYVRRAMIAAAAAAIAVLLALIAGILSLESTKPIYPPRPMFEDLAQKADTVSGFRITQGKDVLDIKLDPATGWTLPSRGGFPADFSKVNDLFSALADLQRVAPRSSLPKWHARLGLLDPGEGSDARLVEVLGTDGSVLASVILGKETTYEGAEGGSMLYVRDSGEPQVWLAAAPGPLSDFGADSEDWLDTTIIDLPTENIARVALAPDGQAAFAITRPSAETANFVIDGLPEDLALKSETGANAIAGVLSGLSLRDVNLASTIDFKEQVSTADFTAFDGLTVHLDLVPLGEDYWARLSAAAGEGANEEVKGVAAALQKRFAPWVYKIDAWRGRQLTVALEDLVEPKTAAEAPASDTPAADNPDTDTPQADEEPATPPAQ